MGYVYKDMERLRFWCQKVLPTVYDDSLSYYELLTKVVQYLNDTVENVNTLIQQVADIDADLSNVAIIDDSVISPDFVWSSQKSNSMMNSKIIDSVRNAPAPANTGSSYSCKYITDNFAGLESGKVKSSQIPDGLVNTIESVSLNGVSVTPDADKNVNIQAVPTSAIGEANGVPSLDANGKVPSSQLPSYVDDVVEGYYNELTNRFYEDSSFEHMITPTGGKCWVDIATNKTYRWTGSGYVRVDEGVQLGETSDTAYAGNKGKANADAIKLKAGTTNLDSGDFACLVASSQSGDELSRVTIVKDSVPTANSQKSIESGGVYTALEGKASKDNVIANTQLIADTVGWSGKNKGYWVNKSLTGDATNGYLLGDNGSSIIAKIENNTNYKVVKKEGQGNRFRVILFTDMPSYTPSLTADQVIHDNTAHEVSFSSGNYNYAVLTYDNASVISQDTAEAMVYDSDILDSTYEPYRDTTAFPRDEQAVLGAKNLFSTKLHVADTYYLKQDEVITLSEGDYILSFNNASDKTVKFWATATSDVTDKGDKFVSAGETAIQNYTVGSGGKVEFAFRFDPQDESISTSSVTEVMIRLATDSDSTYAPYAMTNRELTENKIGKTITLTSADDLDNVIKTGFYAITTAPAHTPEDKTYATLIVNARTDADVKQMLIKDNYIYVRSRGGAPASWFPWYKFTGTSV